MAPTNFKIYVDPGTDSRQPQAPGFYSQPTQIQKAPLGQVVTNEFPEPEYKFLVDKLAPNQRFFFDERKIYPVDSEELSMEEINLVRWRKLREEVLARQRFEELQRENFELKMKLDDLLAEIQRLQTDRPLESETTMMDVQQNSPTMKNRLSVVPQSLQPTQGMDMDMSLYKEAHDGTSVLNDLWRHTMAPHDKFTVPIDQSQYIKDNVPTSTPNNKKSSNEEQKRNVPSNVRRFSRPTGGSPTLKLSPITETSRDGNSKSSSSSSGMTATPSTVKKVQPLEIVMDEIEKCLDPSDPTTYDRLLRLVSEPIELRLGFFKQPRNLPRIGRGSQFDAEPDSYLVNEVLSVEDGLYSAQLLNDDSQDSSMNDSMDFKKFKTVCIRVDRPANQWLFYITNELHMRLARLKTTPDIELSVMMANPAIVYNDGSIMVDGDEFKRYITLEHFLNACQFSKAVGAYIALELIQLVRQLHACDILHLNIKPKNLIINSCPSREDVSKVGERTSFIKLINFDRAMDTRLLPENFKFEIKLDDLTCCEMIDCKPWSHELDWFGVGSCIHRMLFNDDMKVVKNDDKWKVADKQFKNLPSDIWESLFDCLLNIGMTEDMNVVLDKSIEELKVWIQANVGFVLREILTLEESYKVNNKSMNMTKLA